MNNFLNEYVSIKKNIIDKANKNGIDVDFRDAQYLLDMCVAYKIWPIEVLWKDVLNKVIEITNEDISDEKTLNKVKQWTNRYFERAIKDGLVEKTNSLNDKRVVMYKWTKKGTTLLKQLVG